MHHSGCNDFGTLCKRYLKRLHLPGSRQADRRAGRVHPVQDRAQDRAPRPVQHHVMAAGTHTGSTPSACAPPHIRGSHQRVLSAPTTMTGDSMGRNASGTSMAYCAHGDSRPILLTYSRAVALRKVGEQVGGVQPQGAAQHRAVKSTGLLRKT